MTALGSSQPSCVLPLDHRGSFQTEMLGWEGMLQQEQINEIAATELVVYDAFGAAPEAGVPRERGKAVDF